MRQRLERYFNVDADMPEAVRRPMRWMLVVQFALPMCILATIPLEESGIIPDIDNLWFVAIMLVFFVFAWYSSHHARRIIRRAREADSLLCPGCTYDLRTLRDAGTCPECGRAYKHEAVRATWLDAERQLKQK